jgi:hypothetical protein
MKKMKNMKHMMTALIIATVCTIGHAQIKVTNNGKVGIGCTNPLSKLSINTNGDTLYGARIYNPTPAPGACGLFVTTAVLPPAHGGNVYNSILGAISSGDGYAFGVSGRSTNGTPRSSGRALGVYGEASNATSGYNYGVVGVLSGSNNGAAVYGTTIYSEPWGENTEGKFAGYFQGNVYVSNVLTVGTKQPCDPVYSLDVDGEACVISLYESSDARLKENVLGLPSTLDKLRQLRGVTYNFKKPETTSSSLTNSTDTGAVKSDPLEIDPSRYTRKRIGFIAQELQAYYPELVREDGDGMLAVDYNGLIPVIVEAIKEQDSIINVLKQELESLQSTTTSTSIKQQSLVTSIKSNVITSSVLYQNAPNPFNVSTEIRYYIPDQVQQATLYVFNMQGTLLRTNALHDRGYGQIIVNASELKAGMYLYSMVIDGKEVDTKRMILTE